MEINDRFYYNICPLISILVNHPDRVTLWCDMRPQAAKFIVPFFPLNLNSKGRSWEVDVKFQKLYFRIRIHKRSWWGLMDVYPYFNSCIRSRCNSCLLRLTKNGSEHAGTWELFKLKISTWPGVKLLFK